MAEEDAIIRLRDFVNRTVEHKTAVKVLEAGCGSCSHLRFEKEVFMVGIDISEAQLRKHSRLDERILGDIQHHDFPPSIFDVICCWDVLEHLEQPELALGRFASAVKEDGIVILKAPNVFSFKGLLTKCLPYPLHVVFYKYIHGKKKIGEGELRPFKTYLRLSTAPAALKKFAETRGLEAAYFDTYDNLTAQWLKRKRIAYAAYRILKAICDFIGSGRLSDSEFILVLRKPKREDFAVEPRAA